MLGDGKHIDEWAAGLTPQFTIFPFYKTLSPSVGMRKNKREAFGGAVIIIIMIYGSKILVHRFIATTLFRMIEG